MDPDQNPTPLFSDFKDANIFFYIFSYNLPAGTLSSVLKIKFFAKNFRFLFCMHYFSPLNTFMRISSSLFYLILTASRSVSKRLTPSIEADGLKTFLLIFYPREYSTVLPEADGLIFISVLQAFLLCLCPMGIISPLLRHQAGAG
jgi:hypothetical protein